MEQNKQLLKTCSVCGLSKSLNAFLQVSGSAGTSYGNICSTCRSNPPKTKEKEEDTEHEGLSSFGLDANAKIQLEMDKRENSFRNKDADVENRKKRNQLAEEKTEQKFKTEDAALLHRRTYLDAKRKLKGFLDYKSQSTGNAPITAAREATERKSQASETQRTKEAIAEQHEKNTGNLNVSVPIQGHQYSEKRYQTAEFQKFIKRLPSGSPIKAMQELYNKAQQQKNAPAAEKDPLVAHVDKNWNSRRKR